MKQPPLQALAVAFLAVPFIMAAPNGAFAEAGFSSTPDGVPIAQAGEQRPGSFHGRRGAGHGDPEARIQKLQQALGLTAEQTQQIKALRERGRQQSQALREQLRAKRQAMADYMKSPDATEAGALQRFSEVNDIQQRLGELRIRTLFDIRKRLTPEQAAKITTMMEHGPRHGGRTDTTGKKPSR